MDHNRRPRNLKKIEGADRMAEGYNPLCGDQISLFVDLGEGGNIEDIGYTAAGCAISKAAASMMSEAVKGRSLHDARRVVTEFRRLLTRDARRGIRLRPAWRSGDTRRRFQLPNTHQVRDAAAPHARVSARRRRQLCFDGIESQGAVARPIEGSGGVETCTFRSKWTTE